MEFTFIIGFIGAVVGAMAAALWVGLAMVFGFPSPEPQQAGGLIVIGACGLPVLGWALALLNP